MPGPCGPVPVARSRWPAFGSGAPVFAVARWPGPGPGPGPCHLSCPWSGGPVPRSRSWSRLLSRCRSAPVLAPARSRWPGPSPNKADHLCSVASFKQSLPGIWWFYAVLQTTGERQTILQSRNHYRTKTGAKRLRKPTA